jgi:energy-coupling factor transporter transmembrane protein EcfT
LKRTDFFDGVLVVQVHPFARLITAAALLLAIFLAGGDKPLLLVYALVVVILMATRQMYAHCKFLLWIGGPILIALIVVWGIAIPSAEPDSLSSLSRVWVSWLRIVSCGGTLQALFLPLVEKPQHLRNFLAATKINGAIGMLLISSIVFIPEIRRRLTQLIDAHKAQGHEMSGLAGVRLLPHMLMPLISSLLDSSVRRAEFWEHRGVKHRFSLQTSTQTYEPLATALAGVVSIVALGVGLLV